MVRWGLKPKYWRPGPFSVRYRGGYPNHINFGGGNVNKLRLRRNLNKPVGLNTLKELDIWRFRKQSIALTGIAH